MLPAVILAAGDSTRMGSPKALLLTPGGETFVTRIVRTLHEAGVVDLVVVTGTASRCDGRCDHARALSPFPRIIRNPDPSRGQLSSLLAGMDAVVDPTTEGVMMTLVDVPLVRASTVTR